MRAKVPALVLALALAAAPWPAAAQLVHIQAIIAITPNEGGSTPDHPWPDNRLSAPVTIGGAGPYPFVVDTAAERSVISTELADQLDLDVVGQSQLQSMNNARQIDHVRAPDVSYTPGQSQDLQAFAVPSAHIRAAGVLGLDALQGQRVIFDFGGDRIVIEPAAMPAIRAPNEVVVRGRERNGQLVLTTTGPEGVDIDVIIDSGLEVSLGNEALRRLLRPRREQALGLRDAGGADSVAHYGVVDQFRLGGVRLNNLPIAFADAYIFEHMGLSSRPALFLGMETLMLFDRVTVDFPNREASFVTRPRAPS